MKPFTAPPPECHQCSSSSLRSSRTCDKCQQTATTAPRSSKRSSDKSKDQRPSTSKSKTSKQSTDSNRPPTKSSKVSHGKPIKRITELRLRIFPTNDDNDIEDESTVQTQCTPSFKLESLSSSKAYLSGSSSLSETVIEEHWTQSTLSAIRLYRLPSTAFANHPFLDPSYGNDVTKITFAGPCSPKAISTALEHFPAIQTLQFASEFFLHQDACDQDDLSSGFGVVQIPKVKSLTINVDVEKYSKLEESKQKQMESRILSLLQFANEGVKALHYCSLSLPNTPEVDMHLNLLIAKCSSKGIKWTEYANKEIRYKADSPIPASSKPPPPTATSSRKRKAESPEVEITQVLSKEDKVQHVILTSDDDEETEMEKDLSSIDNNVNNLGVPQNVRSSAPPPSSLQVIHYSPELVINLLSTPAWRESNPLKWDTFYCTSIRIGDYIHTTPSKLTFRPVVFSDIGIHFQIPHFTHKDQVYVNIGIPFFDITEAKVPLDHFSSSVYLKTTENYSSWVRHNLGMNQNAGGDTKGFFSSNSKYPCQQFIEFKIGIHWEGARNLFKSWYRSTLEGIDGSQVKTLLKCNHGDPHGEAVALE